MDITQIIILILLVISTLLGFVATKYASPVIKQRFTIEQRKLLYDTVVLGVKAAEKLCKEKVINFDEREAYVRKFLNDMGITYDEEVVKNMIKATVLDLPKTFLGLEDKKEEKK